MVDYLKAIEEFEVQINTARIACTYIKRRFNNNYLAAMGTTREVLEGKVAASSKENEEVENEKKEKEAQQDEEVHSNAGPEDEAVQRIDKLGEDRIKLVE